MGRGRPPVYQNRRTLVISIENDLFETARVYAEQKSMHLNEYIQTLLRADLTKNSVRITSDLPEHIELRKGLYFCTKCEEETPYRHEALTHECDTLGDFGADIDIGVDEDEDESDMGDEE